MRRWGRRLAAGPSPECLDVDVDDIEEMQEDKGGAPAVLQSSSSASTGSVPMQQPKAPCSPKPLAHTTSGRVSSEARRQVPIVPRVSVAFTAKVAAGTRPYHDPPTPGSSPSQSSPQRELTHRTAASERPATLVWLRPFDLRIHDNPALSHAAERRCPLYIAFLWSDDDDAKEGPWRIAGTAYALWLHHALASLDASLQRRYGVKIVYRQCGSVGPMLAQVAQECGADEVVTSRAYDLAGKAADENAAAALRAVGVRFLKLQSFLLYDIEDVKVDMGSWRGHFGTLTPFHSACLSRGAPPKPLAEPRSLPQGGRLLPNDGLAALGLARMPVRKDGTVLDWGASLLEAWDISEDAALAILRRFLAPQGGFGRYEKERNLADASSVSRLSPYLRSGMLSCRLMHWEMVAAGGRQVSVTFWRRLTWRDLAYWQLHHFPKMQDEPIRAHYMGQAWRNASDGTLDAWCRGKTGYPLIDAGMRELWATGWMAQNARMAAAVLLCELLNINWIEGEKWFHHTLFDADPAINAMMWQNAGKGGLDQWNFTLHPARSGRTQDPTGEYVRKWVPELAQLPTRFLHSPWEAAPDVLRRAGVMLGHGGTYPERIVRDVASASRISTDAIRQQRARNLDWNDGGGYDLIVLPRGSTKAHDGQKFRIFTKKDWRLPSGARGGGGGTSWYHTTWDQATDDQVWEEDYTYEEEQEWRQPTQWRAEEVSQESARQRSRTGRARGRGGAQAQGRSSGRQGRAKTEASFQTVLDEYIQKATGA